MIPTVTHTHLASKSIKTSDCFSNLNCSCSPEQLLALVASAFKCLKIYGEGGGWSRIEHKASGFKQSYELFTQTQWCTRSVMIHLEWGVGGGWGSNLFMERLVKEEQKCMCEVWSKGSDKSKALPDLDLAHLTFNFILFQLTFVCCASLRSMVKNTEWKWLQWQPPWPENSSWRMKDDWIH